ncbi:MAG: tetratricopeptide repeat protein [Planctomycetes bacterium]|nr:tetratricopeptide repeat protein [Planctomycetota bacterium]
MNRSSRAALSVFVLFLAAGCVSVEQERRERLEKARFYLEEGDSFAALGNHEQAIESYANAIAEHPGGYAAAHFKRGNAHFRLGHDDDAIQDYTEAMQLSPGFDQALFNRGETFRRKERWAEALGDFQEYRQANPSDARVLVRIADILHDNVPSHRRTALDYYRRYLELAGPDEAVSRIVSELEREFGPAARASDQ